MKGLDQILEKIKATPRPTMISRYLALIAELPTEDEKTSRALDLASVLVKARPEETLRIAHMVFTADRYNLRAIDLMIDAMEVRGRAGKAEVLRLERAKIQEELNEMPVREPSARLPQALFRPQQPADPVPAAPAPRSSFPREDSSISRIAEIDLNPDVVAEAADSGVEQGPDSLARLFPSDPEAAPDVASTYVMTDAPLFVSTPEPRPADGTQISHVSLHLEALQAIPDHKPIDTVLPFGEGVRSLETPKQPSPTQQEMFAPTLSLTSPHHEPAVAFDLARAAEPIPVVAAAPEPVFAMNAAAAVAPAWQPEPAPPKSVRSQEPLPAPKEKSRSKPPRDVRPRTPESNTSSTDFWAAMRHELAQLAKDAPALQLSTARAERVTALLPKTAALPVELVRNIAALDHRLPGMAQALDLKWNLLQSLWAGEADGRLAAMLEELELTDASPAFFGLYLDALVADRKSRRAHLVVRRVLAARPHLAWAKAAWARLPAIFVGLRVVSFAWSEDDGVPALVTQLARRLRPRLSSVLVSADDR